MDIELVTKIFASIIAMAGGLYALVFKIPDRRRKIHMDQHKALQPILEHPLEDQHDLVLETVFRSCFGKTISASEIRFLFQRQFSLSEIERFCKAREHLSWESSLLTFSFKGLNKYKWYLRSKIVLSATSYCLFWELGIQITNPMFVHIQGPYTWKVLGTFTILFILLISVAFFFLSRSSKLIGADRFIKHLPENSQLRSQSSKAHD